MSAAVMPRRSPPSWSIEEAETNSGPASLLGDRAGRRPDAGGKLLRAERALDFCVHQRAGILDRRRRFDLNAAPSIGEAVVGDMSVHSVVPVQGIGGACTFFEASVPSTCVGERTPV
jgi:hypothetical protein